jgi:microcystin-dependent protein
MKHILFTLLLIICLEAAFAQPSGTIVAFGGPKTKVPAGWVLCDGRLYDRTNATYRSLFNAIGVSWGGDGGNKFAVPDLRGQFLRGVSGDSKVDPDSASREKSRPDLNSSGNGGNAVGSKQASQVGRHSHPLTNLGFRNDNLSGGRRDFGGAEFTQFDAHQGLKDITTLLKVEDLNNSETRPVNAYVYFIIKL